MSQREIAFRQEQSRARTSLDLDLKDFMTAAKRVKD
jgi:hypothetical protein